MSTSTASERPSSTTANVLATASSLLASMGLGAVLAIYIVQRFGKTSTTDGFFAAYAVFQLLAAMAQSFRMSVVARLIEGASLWRTFERYAAGVGLIWVLTALPMVVFAAPTAHLLTAQAQGSAHDAATAALVLLWVAAGAQLMSALAAAALATRGSFGVAGAAYVVGSVAAIVLVVALSAGLGIDAIALSLAIGSLVTASILGAALLRAGYRPAARRPTRGPVRAAATLFTGSVGYLAIQIAYVITLAIAARLGEGAVTLYTYAFFAAAVVLGATQGPAGMVLAAPLAREWRGDATVLMPHLAVVLRVSFAIVVPITAIAALVGPSVIELLLGSSLSRADAVTLTVTFLALFGMLVASVASPVPLLAAFAAHRYRAVAVLAVAGQLVHAAASFAAGELGTLPALGAATSLSGVVFTVLLLRLVFASHTFAAVRLLGSELARVLLVVALAFGPLGALVAATEGSDAARWAAAVAGSVAFVVILPWLSGPHRTILERLGVPVLLKPASPAPPAD